MAASSGLPLAAILTAVPRLNFLDRTIFNILIEPIKREFVLSDPRDGPACVLRYFVARHRKSAGGGAEPPQDVAVAFARPSAIAFLLGKAPKVVTPTSARIGVRIGEPVDTNRWSPISSTRMSPCRALEFVGLTADTTCATAAWIRLPCSC